MARPRLPLGAHGKISRTEQAKNAWVAKTRVRDFDGATRLVERRSPTGSVDKYGAQAEAALVDAIAERTAPSASDLTSESMLLAVWVCTGRNSRPTGRPYEPSTAMTTSVRRSRQR